MNNFFKMLKEQSKLIDNKVDTEIFTNMLIDEEYLDGEKLLNCFFCDSTHFDIIIGGPDIYHYLAKSFTDANLKLALDWNNSIEKVHQLGLLCNWFHFHGIPIFADADKFDSLAILICKDYGRILSIKLDKWYYPYCGYLDSANEIDRNRIPD